MGNGAEARVAVAAFADEAGLLRTGDLFVLGVLAVQELEVCQEEVRSILHEHNFLRSSFEWKVNDQRLVPVYEALADWFVQRRGVAFSAIVFSRLLLSPDALSARAWLPADPGSRSLKPADALYNRLFQLALAANSLLREGTCDLHFERRSRVQSARLLGLLNQAGSAPQLQSAIAHRKSEGLTFLQLTDLITSALRRALLEVEGSPELRALVSPSKLKAVQIIHEKLWGHSTHLELCLNSLPQHPYPAHDHESMSRQKFLVLHFAFEDEKSPDA